MATATCKTVAGATSSAQPFKLRASSCLTVSGTELATGRVAWGGTNAPRKAVNWLPSAQTPITLDGKTLNPVWFRALHEVFEHRLGGIDAPTVPQVVVNQGETQFQVLAVQTAAAQTSANLSLVADAVNTVRAVAVQNNLAGSAQIVQIPNFSQIPIKAVVP